ncbi:MAG: phosphatidate cytidylyltransferase [Taibaiella sp.]|nr:phosphatidate cytidylyltransferase [Taibaiella sp.]
MALNLPTFYKRTGSAIVFAIIMLAGLLWNQWSFLALVCLIEFLCYREFILLVKKIFPDTHWPEWMTAIFSSIGVLLLLPVNGMLASMNGIEDSSQALSTLSFVWMALPVLPALLFMAALLSKKDALHAFLLSVLGMLYITLPMIFLLYMHSVSYIIPLALILMIWTNDTMAYLVGSFIGKTPFSPISPKKTWEGTIGGAILTMAGAAAYGYFAHQFPYIKMIDWVMLALCAAVAGTLGDLMESKLKRMANVKDSGAIMPGHGGALDRFDSLLVATPFALTYVWLFMR